MPTVEEVTVSYSRKVQLDDFEPIQHAIEMSVALSDDDDPAEVYSNQMEIAENAVERELARRISRKKADSGDE